MEITVRPGFLPDEDSDARLARHGTLGLEVR